LFDEDFLALHRILIGITADLDSRSPPGSGLRSSLRACRIIGISAATDFQEGNVIQIGGYTGSGFGAAPGNPHRTISGKRAMTVKFVNSPIAEASASFFGAEKRGSGLLAAWTGRPDPSLTYSLMSPRTPINNAAGRRCRRSTGSASRRSRASEGHRAAPQGIFDRCSGW